MKKGLLCMLLLGHISFTWAQTMMDNLTDEICDCIKEKIPLDTDPDALEMQFGLCAIEAASGKQEEIKEELGIDLDSQDKFVELGEKIGMKLAVSCPYFLELFMKAEKDTRVSNANEEVGINEVSSDSGQLEGILTEFSGNGILILHVQGEQGSQLFHCISEFKGAELLKLKDELFGKEIILTFRKSNLFNQKSFEFEEIDMITSLKLK